MTKNEIITELKQALELSETIEIRNKDSALKYLQAVIKDLTRGENK